MSLQPIVNVAWQGTILDGDRWITYEEFAPNIVQSNTPTVLVIAPGAGQFSALAAAVARRGMLVEEIHAENYVPQCANCRKKASPPFSTCCERCGQTGGLQHAWNCDPFSKNPYHLDPIKNMPNWELGPEHWDCEQPNLASFGKDVVVPCIKDLIRNGRGPAAVICGSRSGDITIVKVWEQWRGPTLILNGAPLRAGLLQNNMRPWHQVPQEVPLYLVVGGRDYSYATDHTGELSFSEFVPSVQERLREFQTMAPVPLGLQGQHMFVYYHPTDEHSLLSLRSNPDMFEHLLHFIVRRDFQNSEDLYLFVSEMDHSAEIVMIDRSGSDNIVIHGSVAIQDTHHSQGVEVTIIRRECCCGLRSCILGCYRWFKRKTIHPQRREELGVSLNPS